MIRFLFLSYIVIQANCLFSQHLKAVIFNPEEEIVPQADVYRNGVFVKEASAYGSFEINVEAGDELKIFRSGYQPSLYRVLPNMPDTFFISINLDYKYQEINEVIVSTNGIKRIIGSKNEHIIDYQPLPEDHFYTLKSIGRSYFLCLENLTQLITQKEINFKPESLYRDFLGNIHILSKDSVYQIFLDGELKLLHAYPKQYFESFLKPVVATSKNGIFSEAFTSFNQQYDLFHKNAQKDFETILHLKDSVGEFIARETYYRIISAYNKSETIMTNLIMNGVWDGDIAKLCSAVTAPLIGLYKTRSRPLNISSTDRGKQVLTFDFLNHLIYHIDKDNSKYSSIEMSSFENYNKLKLLPDYEVSKYYLSYEIKGICHIYEIDPDTGIIEEKKEVKGASFLRNMKINNGVLYFLNPVNDFQKLFQTKL